MNTPFQLGPSPRLLPKRAAILPATGARNFALRLGALPAGAAGPRLGRSAPGSKPVLVSASPWPPAAARRHRWGSSFTGGGGGAPRLDLAGFVLLLLHVLALSACFPRLAARAASRRSRFFRGDLGVGGRFRGALLGQQLLAFLPPRQRRPALRSAWPACRPGCPCAVHRGRHCLLPCAAPPGAATNSSARRRGAPFLHQQGLLFALFLRDLFQLILGVLHVRLVFLHGHARWRARLPAGAPAPAIHRP